ncbi:DUF1768 domain containing protein [Listeria phage LMTA-94]|uniref:DUF1768 domain containing protein n=2 Tax=Pecentumvirus LMSP25 TaxID=2560554 RepID=A0A068C8B5_9CAUD|nr:DUF1768 domain containing protein [Listeria phage LMTA-57]YP_009793632.1 DUF1768 domain containing protein [Listeria phage LMTA-94]AID17221.1 DUF1768 domain containing protein [Listeria phage LMTA-94]AID17618.1 DUF1768 domain containing protein [Listeria phage LMTA-57]
MRDKYTFFWGKESPFSNWHPSIFSLEYKQEGKETNKSVMFHNAEQAFMYEKARLFKDELVASQILSVPNGDPKTVKSLGRKVRGFNEATWDDNKEAIVFIILMAKFSQNKNLKAKLEATKGTTLVEASPYDTIWGVGLRESDPRILNKDLWRGSNLLGKTLQRVRDN